MLPYYNGTRRDCRPRTRSCRRKWIVYYYKKRYAILVFDLEGKREDTEARQASAMGLTAAKRHPRLYAKAQCGSLNDGTNW